MPPAHAEPPVEDPHAARAGRARPLAWLVRAMAGNADAAVYGAVLTGVLLAAEDTSHESYLEAVEVAAIVLVLYWLTHFYTHTLALRLRRGESLTPRLVWRGFLYEFPVVEGAAVPLATLLVAWALGATVTLGVAAALWASIGTIFILEVMAVWRQRRHSAAALLQVAAGVVMGIAIIAVKLVLH